MRKLIFVFLAFLLIQGCSFPFKENSNNKNENTQSEKSFPIVSFSGGTNSNDNSIAGTSSFNPVSGTKYFQSISVTIYYKDKDDLLIPVTRKIEKQDGIARASVAALIDNAANRERLQYFGLYPVLPQGTEVLGLDIKDGIATIDFNSAFLGFKSQLEEKNAIAAVVYTLTEFATVDNVKILVNGELQKSYKFSGEMPVMLNRDNIMINSDKLLCAEGKNKSDIYLHKVFNEKYTYLAPLSIEHSKIDVQYVASKLVELMDNDYSDKKLVSFLPPGTKIVDSSISGNVLVVNFNENLVNYGGAAREEALLNQLLFSMKQISGIEKVRIMVNSKRSTLPEGTDISKDVIIPSLINDYIDP